MISTKLKYCPYCGKKFEKYGMNFCTYCGKNLKRFRGSSTKKVSCTICHELVSLRENENIKCSYCGSQYHRNCITSWLLKYNSCPMCLNVFLKPNLISLENVN